MEKAVCYVRVSTEEQVTEGVSLKAQEEKLRSYCRLLELEPVIITDKGISAGKPLVKRPGGKKLLKLVKGGTCHVVAWKMDRLFRDALDALAWTREWDKKKVILHLVDVGGAMVNSQGAMGRFFLHMLAGFAELERGLISERTATALAHKKKHLKVYGPVPMGFQRDGDDLVEFKEEMIVVDRIIDLVEEERSYNWIAKKFNEENVPSKKGGRWYASTIQRIYENGMYYEEE